MSSASRSLSSGCGKIGVSRQSDTSRRSRSSQPRRALSLPLAASGSDCLDTSLAARRRFSMFALKVEMTGQRFGRLVVICEDGRALSGAVRWRCRCDCGTTKSIEGRRLRSGATVSCGCYAREQASVLTTARQLGKPRSSRVDLLGRRYGRWTVLRFDAPDPRGHLKWICQCECGETRSVRGSRLQDGQSQSCGCLAAEQASIRTAGFVGEKHPTWKGEDAGYFAMHVRVNAARGRPQHCEQCGTTDPSKTYEWASLTHRYDDVDDYRRMCRSCHRKYDGIKPPPRTKR